MIKVLIEGFVLGITLAFMIGPAFFALIQTSINRGFKAGVQMAVGISLSDTILVFLMNLGIIHIIDAPIVQLLFGVIGGIILIGFGLYTYLKKEITHETHEVQIKGKWGRAVTFILKGFFLNFMNPFVWVFWITVSVGMSSNLQTKENILLFFTTTLLTLLATDVVKCFIANKIKRILSPKVLFFINKTVGLILFVFGIVLIVRVFLENIKNF